MLIFLGNIRLIIFGSIMFILSLESNATTFWESHAHNFQSQWDFEKIEDKDGCRNPKSCFQEREAEPRGSWSRKIFRIVPRGVTEGPS